MRSAKKLSGVVLASAAATLLLAGCGGASSKEASMEKKTATPATKVATIKCSGINSCKGTSAWQQQQVHVKDKTAVKAKVGLKQLKLTVMQKVEK